MPLRTLYSNLLLSFLLGLIAINGNAQYTKIELLESKLSKEKIDTVKVDLLYQLGSEYWDYDFEKGLAYSRQCLTLAEKIKYPKGIAQGNTNLGLYYYFNGEYGIARSYYQKALLALNGKTYGDFPAYTYTRIGNLYRVQSNYDSAQFFYSKSLKQLQGQKPGYATSSTLHNLALLYYIKSDYDSAILNFSESLELRKQLRDTMLMAESWRGLGMAYMDNGQYDSADLYFEKIIDVANKFKNPELEMFYLLYKGMLLFETGNAVESIDYLTRSLEISDQHNFVRYRVTMLYFIGKVYTETGEFSKGADYLIQALQLNKQLRDFKQDADITMELGRAFAHQKNQLLAKEYVAAAKALYSKINLVKETALINNLQGAIAYEWKEYDSAAFYYKKSLEINQANQWNKGTAAALFNLSLVYDIQGKYNEAYSLQMESLAMEEKYGNIVGIIISYNSLGKLLEKMGNLEMSRFYLMKCRAILNHTYSPIYLKENALFLAQLNTKEGRFKEANKYYQEYIQLSDSLYSSESLNRSLQYNSLYKLNEKEDEIRILNQSKEIQQGQLQLQESQLRNQRLYIVFSILIIGFFIAFSYALYKFNKKIAKARDVLKSLNFEVQEKNEEIEAQSEELTEANIKISSINEELEKKVEIRAGELKEAHKELDTFFYRSSHDFRRPLTTFIGLAEVAKIAVKDSTALNLFDKVKENALSLDKMLRKLQSMSIVNAEELIFREISFKEVVTQLENKFQDVYEEKKMVFTNKVSIGKPFYSYPEIVMVILENLIENGIDFSGHGTKLDISIANSPENVIIEIKNNGEGIRPESIPHVFDMFFRGSNNSKGNGLGLYIAKKAVEKLRGTIRVKDALPESTIFLIELPFTG